MSTTRHIRAPYQGINVRQYTVEKRRFAVAVAQDPNAHY